VSELDLARVAESRRQAEALSGLRFSIWVGNSEEKPRALAERLHAGLEEPDRSVYLVCVVKQRALEIVTGSAARQTLTDEECLLATRSMREVLAHGDVSEALVRGLGHLGTYAMD
jgi:UDP-2,3-diacylglucosamine pyrophosphatase LpxH